MPYAPPGNAVFAEQVRQLYHLSRPSYLGTLANACIVTLVLWGIADKALLVAWLAVMVAVIGARYSLYRAYRRAPHDPGRARAWARRFIAGAATTGVLWGFVGSALFPSASIPHQFLVIFLIGGMVVSAMVILAPVRQAFLSYMLPPMALVIATVFAQGGSLHLFMGVLLLVFMGVMLVTGPVLSDMMRESLHVKFENTGLLERMSHANRELSERIDLQQRTEEALRRNEQRYRHLFESNPIPMWIRDEESFAMLAVNAAALRAYGYTADEFLRLKSTDLHAPGEAERYVEAMRTSDPRRGFTSRWRHRRRDGGVIEVETVSHPIEFDGRHARLTLASDITERTREERLRNLESAVTVLLADAGRIDEVMPRVLETICTGLDCAYGACWVFDAKDRSLRCAETWSLPEPGVAEFRSAGSAWLPLSGMPMGMKRRAWATGAPVQVTDIERESNLLRRQAAMSAGLRSAFAFPILVGGEFYGVMEFFSRLAGPRDERAIEAARSVGSHIGQFIGRKQAENNLQFVASHDPLTGLFNRGMFGERLQQALAQAQRFERVLALLFIDLDGFKSINDTLGHTAGDAALVEIAARLRATLREGDVIARMGGDEFVVLVEEFDDETQVAEVAKKVLETVGRPITLQNQDHLVTASIGISTYPRDAADAQALLRNADVAMYRAKEGGRNNFRFFYPEMDIQLVERLKLESGLRRALERGELRLAWQPRVGLADGAITGVEAFVRWQHPTQGVIGPREFVPLAEDGGLMNAIGAWVLRTACAQARAWQDQGLPAVRVAVNLSMRQFAQENLIEVVRSCLTEARLEPARLELEITEAMLMRNTERGLGLVAQLRELGVRVTLDDFGTGHASLGCLMRCPVDGVKLDRSFVLKLPGDAQSATIARAVIAMAHSLKLSVTAEGVETREQKEFLDALDCDEIQGHYFSEPVAPDVVPRLLRTGATPARRAVVHSLHPRRGPGDADGESG